MLYMLLKPIRKAAQTNTHFGSFSEALLACKVLEAEQLKEVARQATEAKMPLEQFLVQKDLVDPAAFTLAEAAYFNMAPLALPDNFTVNQDLLCGKSEDFWIKVKAVPIAKLGGRLTIALADPFNLPSQEEVTRAAGGHIWPCVAPERQISDALARLKAARDASNPALAMESIMKGDESELEVLSEMKTDVLDASLTSDEDAPVIRMVKSMMIEALKTKASDIHFEALENA